LNHVRRIAVIFLVAVFVPSLVLGFLALRTAGEQRNILERQLSELYQKDADQLAGQLQEAILGRQREFADRVRVLLSSTGTRPLANDFSQVMDAGADGVAFVVAPDGIVVAPRGSSPETARFLRENEAFLSNRAEAEFFPTQQATLNNYSPNRKVVNNGQTTLQNTNTANASNSGNTGVVLSLNNVNGQLKSLTSSSSNTVSVGNNTANTNAGNNGNAMANNSVRTVQPQSNAGNFQQRDANMNMSRVAPQVSDFETATSGTTDGVMARYAQNALELILWTRPPEADGYVFGFALSAKSVRELVKEALSVISPEPRDACIAVLDENAQPVAVSHPNFTTDWKRPFVASEIGEILPHWATALYLLQPGQLAQSARLVTLTIILLIAVALAAILAGGGFVAFDARRQLILAQKKTDFVSNVSHELKTPLTSIRMFAELLEQGRIDEPEKRSRYLRIIILESERLTRLINNVLDFARGGKKQKTYHMAEVDLLRVVDRVWEAQSIHLQEAGFTCERVAKDAPYPVVADADAIGQVLVNLLSNAEKYSGTERKVGLHSSRENGSVLISVLDRGVGVPEGETERIFEAFHRSNDSLASNIQGSGLGLTLARNIARDHGGDIEYHKRDGGGSVFILRLPATASEEHS
jgi:signal transduction histidine kinase